ncbi:hypothetical protein TTHERM_000760749 (macronuclear) [Tetrahymena thermophila SB210]|uniref:Uncharacterized protein n=1 Tax=Tetrahymena thermophila (strain SB210) TaxID=312017 RepID=W7XD50_TETTS|nr:hypothetical protein TTHERM_000760749 [Tetrahymena thermophila SB210]EWS71746.1 hypothetical protein TTHERM_000760749 [Tetrahymena thermophila SB210]|eukprot:XP_012655732.1 hypothetical protein TTHERM_000760749 [Tetrahymena thermophila SB210]
MCISSQNALDISLKFKNFLIVTLILEKSEQKYLIQTSILQNNIFQKSLIKIKKNNYLIQLILLLAINKKKQLLTIQLFILNELNYDVNKFNSRKGRNIFKKNKQKQIVSTFQLLKSDFFNISFENKIYSIQGQNSYFKIKIKYIAIKYLIIYQKIQILKINQLEKKYKNKHTTCKNKKRIYFQSIQQKKKILTNYNFYLNYIFIQ